ncbi:hypothetical protein GBAR_LOCUS20150 [Geodia barretti]|uniref:Uncharacterized protein n=1 Tax=Geodia barretti TaxID=519541 RepID=A0AA35X0Z1_GEOBA|nr:hypothetical protein GBAR_LOCUS20150 [Geodia barretti]
MSYEQKEKFLSKTSYTSSSCSSNSEDEDEFEYEKRSRMGPQGANAECDICGSSILVKAVSTDSGVSNLCWRHRVANACTIQVE